MLLSIVVTVYNREAYLRRCLMSLLHQDLDPSEYEIIVVNDGSTDHSAQIIDEFVRQYSNIKKIDKSNSGVADTRNVGLRHATGTYLTYVDSDDFAEANAYGSLLQLALNHDYDIVVYDAYKTYDDHREYLEFEPEMKEGELDGHQYVLFSPAPWNKLMKRSLFERGNISFPSGMIYEDYATIPLLANVAQSYYYVKTPVVNYYQENDSITRGKTYQAKWNDMLKASKQLERLDTQYHTELEFNIYLYLLVRTSVNFLACDHYEELHEIASYMKQTYPSWRKNPYVKQRDANERFLAFMFSIHAGKGIKAMQKIKHLIRR